MRANITTSVKVPAGSGGPDYRSYGAGRRHQADNCGPKHSGIASSADGVVIDDWALWEIRAAGTVILADGFAMMAEFCSSSRQAADSAKPFVALGLP